MINRIALAVCSGVLLVSTLAACGGGSSSSDVSSAQSSGSASPTPATPMLTLAQACHQVVVKTPQAMIPTSSDLLTFQNELDQLAKRSDSASNGLIALLQDEIAKAAASSEKMANFDAITQIGVLARGACAPVDAADFQ